MKMADKPQGREVRLCNARLRQSEGRCRKQAGWGTSHVGEGACRLHGGSTAMASKGAHLRLLERSAAELFGKSVPDAEPVTNPLAAYAEFAGEVMQWKAVMRSLLDGLQAPGYSSENAGEQVHAAVTLYERAMDRADKVLNNYARLGIDERLLKVSTAQSKTIMRAIEAVIAYFQGSTEQTIAARRLATQHLRSVVDEAS